MAESDERAAHREALHFALSAVASSERAEWLMLRGSALMSNWYPTEAREPGDLDFVVFSADWKVDDAGEFLEHVAQAAEQLSKTSPGRVRIDAAGARTQGIWEYDRAPGRRLTMPFAIDGQHVGDVQLDFVFGETLTSEPERGEITLSDQHPGVSLLIAPKSISLAWKLSWLLVDYYPAAKDLYDAVLLAEDDSLDRLELRKTLLEVFEHLGDDRTDAMNDLDEIDAEPDWSELQRVHPNIRGTADEWLRRLIAALKR